ncbi:MAG: choice-of-anchor C family protein [Vicinamibacterales bacterium]
MFQLSRVAAVRVVGLALLASALALNTATASSILINGSFELTSSDMPGSGELLAGSTQITGWTVSGTSLSNDVIDWLGPGGGGPLWNASDGTHLVELDGRNSLNGAIYQTFATLVGQTYQVSFDLSGNPGDGRGTLGNGLPLVKQVRVAVGGVTHDYQFDSTGLTTVTLLWQPISFAFIASGTTETLSFTSLTPTPNSYGALVDDVRVEPALTAVPEPTSLLLLGTGLLGVVGRRWRRE